MIQLATSHLLNCISCIIQFSRLGTYCEIYKFLLYNYNWLHFIKYYIVFNFVGIQTISNDFSKKYVPLPILSMYLPTYIHSIWFLFFRWRRNKLVNISKEESKFGLDYSGYKIWKCFLLLDYIILLGDTWRKSFWQWNELATVSFVFMIWKMLAK